MYIGDSERMSVWDPDTGYVYLHDFRVYSGSYFTTNDPNNEPLLGCA